MIAMDGQWRPAERSDADALAALFRTVEEFSALGLESDAEAVGLRLDHPGIDLAQRTRLVTDASGRAVAYAEVCAMGHGPDGFRIRLTSVIHPEFADHLTAQVHEWLEEHAHLLHLEAAPNQVALAGTRCGDRDQVRADLLRRAGYDLVRRAQVLVRDPIGSMPQAPPPAGLTITPFTPRYDEATRLAHNEAYAESSSAVVFDARTWPQHATGQRSFLPAASLLALTDAEAINDQVAAFILALDGGTVSGRREAVLECLGTLPAWRGRGLARALIARALTTCQSLGFERARLQVDSTNTAALHLYDTLGFGDSGGGQAILIRRRGAPLPAAPV
jgi:mycothiol synthase